MQSQAIPKGIHSRKTIVVSSFKSKRQNTNLYRLYVAVNDYYNIREITPKLISVYQETRKKRKQNQFFKMLSEVSVYIWFNTKLGGPENVISVVGHMQGEN